MTSEVCLMNRRAVVLAADSATTVTHWVEGRREERYFKGTNKIFELSAHNPVGIMVFDSADLLRVPWEISIKQFRRSLGKRSFNSLDEYAQEFFGFIDTNLLLFPEDARKEAFVKAVSSASLRFFFSNSKELENDEKLDVATLGERADRYVEELKQLPFPNGIDEEFAHDLKLRWRDDVQREVLAIFQHEDLKHLVDIVERFTELGLEQVVKKPEDFLDTTGIVFAGYGDADIYPKMIHFQSFGILGSKHVSKEQHRIVIDSKQPAALHAFAQTSMPETFSMGISGDVYMLLMEAVAGGLRQFATEIVQRTGGSFDGIDAAECLGIIENARRSIGETILEEANRKHAWPLKRVLGALPIEEMADLAETLINLQSLKEKVTKPTESVSGPTDVAVLTRNEGFLWIKRKHFFDPALNSRYFLRQGSLFA